MVIEQNPKNWLKRKYKHVLTMGYRYADFLLITLKRMTSWPEEKHTKHKISGYCFHSDKLICATYIRHVLGRYSTDYEFLWKNAIHTRKTSANLHE